MRFYFLKNCDFYFLILLGLIWGRRKQIRERNVSEMISLGSRDGRKVLEQGFSSSNKREMNENELEEGEACSYQDVDTTIDPDVTLSYIDEKLHNLLGHVMKDFEGAVSAESLGAKFGIYGSFLPAHRRSPIWSQSKSPPRVQNHIAQSPNTLQTEVGQYNTLAPASFPCQIKQGSASAGSASSYVYKPPPQNDVSRQNARTNSIQALEECTPKSVVHDQKTLKVRIKVGSDNMCVKKNAAIYNGLGLDGSPTSSHDDSPLETEGLSCRLSFNSFESPTRILQIMTSSPLFGGCILSPLPDYLICLSERPKHLQEILTQPSSKAKPENSIIGHPSFSFKDKKIISDNSMRSLDRKGVQDMKDEMDCDIGYDFQSKETDIEAITCEQLVSNALKLPLLSNAHDNIRDSPERGFSDASKRDPTSAPVSLSEKPQGKAISAGIVSHNEAVEVWNDSVTSLEKVGNGKNETADKTTKFGAGWSKSNKASKIGLKYPGNQDTDKSTFRGNSMNLPCGKEPFSLGDEKIPKKSQPHESSSRKAALEFNKGSAQVLKDRKSTDPVNNAYRIQVQKDSSKARGQYADFFGEINEQDDDIMNSPDVPSGEMLKTSEEVDKTTLTYENTSRERTSDMETCKGTISGAKSRGYSNNASVPENGQPIPEPPPINWVGCDKCQKWRIIPPGAKSDNLPDKWDCSMMTWLLPNKNRCSTSEEESNGDVHAPPPGMTSADYLSSAVAINGTPIGKVRKTSKSTFQNSPKKLPSSLKKKQQLAKEKTLKETKDSCPVNGRDFQQHPKSGDTYSETGQHKKMEKHKTDYYSDGGYAKIPNIINCKRGPEQEFSKASKKSKTWSKQTEDIDKEAAHNQGVEILGVSSGRGSASGKNRVSNSEVFASQNTKDDTDGIPPDSFGKSNAQFEALSAVGSVHVSKSGSKSKRRKGDNFQDPPSSTPSGKLMDDHEKASRKRHKISKSEGKDSSVGRHNGKADKKNRSVSQHKLNIAESVQKDSLCVNPVVAATSSSSKVSGSLKVKSKLQEVKGSPVESVSSSPVRISKSDRLTSGCKVTALNDNVPGTVKVATRSPARCSAAHYEGSGDQSGGPRKDIAAASTHHGSPNYSKIDVQGKSRGGLQLTNGNGCIDNLDLDNAYPSEPQAPHRSVNETSKIDIHLDTNMSNSEKSWKGSPSLSPEKDQTLKSNSGKGKGKVSEYDNSLDHIYEEREKDRKKKIDDKCASIADKTEIFAKFPNKELSLPESEDRDNSDKKRSSRKFDVEKPEDLVPVSAKEKSRHVPRSDDEKNETSNIIQTCHINKASTSANDARPDGLAREPRLNKKADGQNGTHTPSKHPIPNGNRIKNHDAPSPLRRDPSSQAASSAIKEATNLKHLADRLKNSGSTESTGMYFEAALKFLHGASLLESGKTENIKHADIAQSMRVYSSTAKLCQFCAREFEKSKDMATAALAYKCEEVAYLRVIYSSHNSASRDRNELQNALQMVPPGESPSSSASDLDNLNNTANGDKAAQSRSGGSPQLASNLVISGRNRPNFSRILNFTQDVNSAMEASRKSRVAFGAASGSIKDGITPIKRALDFNFHDVDGLLRLVRLAKEAISR